MEDKISVIVPTYNEEKFIVKTLKALQNQTVPRSEYEIIVSDSSSTDKTRETAKKHADRVVKCKKHSAGVGRNFGAKNAKHELMAFIDADTIVSEKYLEGVREALQNGVAATGPVKALEKDSLFLRFFFWWWGFQSKLTITIGFPIFPGFSFAARKSAFEKVGGFHIGDITTEDFELSLRMKKIGRINYNQKMSVKSSTRRFKEKGPIYNVWNAWRYLLFGESSSWNEHRSDF